MPLTNYEVLTLESRLNMLELVEAQLNELDLILRETFDEIDRVMANLAGTDDIVRRRELEILRRSISDVLDETFDAVEDSITQSMRSAVEIARDGNLAGAIEMFDEIDRRYSDSLPVIFQQIPDNATRAVLSRMLDDGKLFSDRIWDLQQFSDNEISKTVTRGVLQGKSHTELMKDLEPFLRMDDQEFQAFQRTWAETHDEAWKADWKTRGRLKYNLQRLSRSEINNAHREAQVLSARVSPWVKALKWNLSASHPKPDICDTWATQDLHGLGPGIYPFDDVPLDHPNGLCFITNVLVSQEEINSLTLAGR
jgi:hypothetical protein